MQMRGIIQPQLENGLFHHFTIVRRDAPTIALLQEPAFFLHDRRVVIDLLGNFEARRSDDQFAAEVKGVDVHPQTLPRDRPIAHSTFSTPKGKAPRWQATPSSIM